MARNQSLLVKEVGVSYGPVNILSGISLELAENEILGIVGPNGHGKTTLLKSIAGLNPPASGEIWFNGKRIDLLPPHEIVGSGIVLLPEGGGYIPQFTMLENLRLGGYTNKKLLGDNLEAVYRLFPWMKERPEQLAWTLSGGQRRMLAVARCLMANSKLLLFDEPSWGVAPKVRAEIVEIMRSIRKMGRSFLLADSDIQFTRTIADRLLLLKNSRLVPFEEGMVKEDSMDSLI